MAKELQIRRGTTQANDLFIGKEGELSMDTTTKGLRVHDGQTAGGFKIGHFYPDYASGTNITLTGITTWTAPINCFVSYQSGLKNGAQEALSIDGVRIALNENAASSWVRSTIVFYMKAGQTLTGLTANDSNRNSIIYYFPLLP